LALHVFYFLHSLFQYLKSPDEFAEDAKLKKLGAFSKGNLDLRDFFTKILPEIASTLEHQFKDANVEDKVKAAKLPDEALRPFKEKAPLVFLSIANSITMEKFRVIIFNEPKRLTAFVKSLKKLSSKIVFAEPYHIYFEKKKLQVLRKVIDCIAGIFME